jgi:hypothetical protein
MSLSLHRAIKTLQEKKQAIDYYDLMFLLVSLRDNARDDEVHEALERMVLHESEQN